MNALESIAATAASAIVTPLAQELVKYITGQTNRLPSWVSKLPTTLQSRIAIDARKAREELAGAKK